MFQAALAQIPKLCEKTSRCWFLSQAITLEPIYGSGFFPSGVSSKRFFTAVDFVWVDLLILSCIDSWTNEYSDPRFRIFRAQGLQTRLEYLSHFTTSIPTFWQTWAKTSPLQSFLLDGLKRFSVEMWLDFKLPNWTLKLQSQSLHRSLGFIDTYFHRSLFWP